MAESTASKARSVPARTGVTSTEFLLRAGDKQVATIVAAGPVRFIAARSDVEIAVKAKEGSAVVIGTLQSEERLSDTATSNVPIVSTTEEGQLSRARELKRSAPREYRSLQPVPEFLVPKLQELGFVFQDGHGKWVLSRRHAPWIRRTAVEVLREIVEHRTPHKDPNELTTVIIAECRMAHMFSKVFGSLKNAKNALKEAAYTEEHPVPGRHLRGRGYYSSKRNRVHDVLELERKTGKKPTGLTFEDFKKNKLRYLAMRMKGASNAILEAHDDVSVFDLAIKMPRRYLTHKSRRQREMRIIAPRLKEKKFHLKDITTTLLNKEGYPGLIGRGESVEEAFREAGVRRF